MDRVTTDSWIAKPSDSEIEVLFEKYGAPRLRDIVENVSLTKFNRARRNLPYKGHVILITIRKSGDLVFIRETGTEEWAVPHGTIYQNETVEDAVFREAQEETGLTVGIRELVSLDRTRLLCGYNAMELWIFTFIVDEKKGILNPTDKVEIIEIKSCKYIPKKLDRYMIIHEIPSILVSLGYNPMIP